jgi:hypothetical protein
MENTQQQTSECKTCKQKGPSGFQIGSLILGFYILISSGYGTVQIFKNLYELLFK